MFFKRKDKKQKDSNSNKKSLNKNKQEGKESIVKPSALIRTRKPSRSVQAKGRRLKGDKQGFFLFRLFKKFFGKKQLSGSKNSKSKGATRSAMRRWQNLSKSIKIGVFVLVVLGFVTTGVYLIVGNVIELKLGTEEDDIYSLYNPRKEVIGIEDVPQFPSSKFIYENYLDDETVQDFLKQKQSAYSIPLDSSWVDVVEFYKAELEKRGWQHVNSIDRSDSMRLYGEYWIMVEEDEVQTPDLVSDDLLEDNASNSDEGIDGVNSVDESVVADDDNEGNPTQDESSPSKKKAVRPRGLRIYTRLNDIWYQEITVSQARTGLADIVSQRSELDFLISMSSGRELPPEVPWQLKFSPEWNFELKDSDFGASTIISFTNPRTSSRLLIQPIAYSAGQDLKQLAQQFLTDGNLHREQSEQFSLKTEQSLQVAGIDAFVFNIGSNTSLGSLCVLSNPRDEKIYVIVTYKGETAFFNYVIENLKLPPEEEQK